MGNQTGVLSKSSKVPNKPLKLTSDDIAFINKSTGLPADQIEN